MQGSVLLDGRISTITNVDPIGDRRRIGMVFQRPNPFPTLSILDNVARPVRDAAYDAASDGGARRKR